MTVLHAHAGHVPGRLEGISGNVESFARHLATAGVPTRLLTDDVRLEDLNRLSTHVAVARRARLLLGRARADPSARLVHYHANIAAMGTAIPPRLAPEAAPVLFHIWNAVYNPTEDHSHASWRARSLHRGANGARAALRGLERAAAVVVSTDYQRRQLARLGYKGEVHVVPNGVNLERFHPARPEDRRWARAEYGLEDRTTIVYYGHLSPWKGVDVLVEALPRVLREHGDVQVVVAHTTYGANPQRIRRRLEALGILDRIHFEGTVDVPTLLHAADVVALPIVAPVGTALQPNTLLEGMAAGTAVVTTDVGSLPELVQDGVNGRLVPPADPDRLADALLSLVDEPWTRQRLAQNARKTIEEGYGWPSVVRRMAALYERFGVGAARPVPLPEVSPA